jgi:thiamine pyrophosphate-dependent acetolactate synthase large subunit-like protein
MRTVPFTPVSAMRRHPWCLRNPICDVGPRLGDPLNPELLFWEASPRLPDRTVVAADSGTSASWFARALRLRRGMMASLSDTLATMGCAIPYAIAAKFCYPDRVAIAFVGDGAMQMLGTRSFKDLVS